MFWTSGHISSSLHRVPSHFRVYGGKILFNNVLVFSPCFPQHVIKFLLYGLHAHPVLVSKSQFPTVNTVLDFTSYMGLVVGIHCDNLFCDTTANTE